MTTTEDGKATADGDFVKLLGQVKGLSDAHLGRLVTAAAEEQAAREQQRKDAAIAKIRALAGDAGIVVSIAGARGGKRVRAKPRSRREKHPA